jgi:small nuclear ribonucleoprotein (snRNP)-like protein
MYKKKERGSISVNDGFIDLILNSVRVDRSKASENIKNELLKLGKINIRITTILLENGEE